MLKLLQAYSISIFRRYRWQSRTDTWNNAIACWRHNMKIHLFQLQQAGKQTVGSLLIWDTKTLMWRHCNENLWYRSLPSRRFAVAAVIENWVSRYFGRNGNIPEITKAPRQAAMRNTMYTGFSRRRRNDHRKPGASKKQREWLTHKLLRSSQYISLNTPKQIDSNTEYIKTC